MSMEPTVSWVIKRTALTVIFWVIAVVAVLYLSGLRFNWQSHRLTPTSSLMVELYNKEHKAVSYTLNGQVQVVTTPLQLSRLTPGSYTLTIKAENRVEWQRTFTLAAYQAVDLQNVILVPSIMTPRTPTDKEKSMFSLPTVSVSEGLRVHENELYDTTGSKDSLVLRLSEAISQAIWLPNQSHIVILANQSVALVEAGGTNLTPLFSVPAGQPVSLAVSSDGGTVIAKVGDTIQAYDIIDPQGRYWYSNL